MKLRTVIVDDEKLAREELAYLLERQGGAEVVGQAGDGIQAMGLVEDLVPDLVFLDVQMPGLSGFDLARRLLERPSPPEVVFVTAYDHYAVDAFQVNAVDYLLKPVDPARLEQAVQRAARRLAAGRGPAAQGLTNEDIERIVQVLTERQARQGRLAVKVGDRFLLISADDVVYASVAGEAVTIVANSLAGTSNYRTLDELQAHLDPNVFWRVHRSHVVNINKIKEIVPWFSRNYILRMKDAKSTEIPVSRAQTRRLRQYLRL